MSPKGLDEASVQSDDKASFKSNDQASINSNDQASVNSNDQASVQSNDEASVNSNDQASVKSNDKASVQSAEEDELAHVRLNSAWFQWFRIAIKFAFICQELPFSLNFEKTRYTVQTSTRRKLVWALFHIGGALVYWSEVASMMDSIKSSYDPYQYFDLLISIGWLMFDYPIQYIWLCGMKRVQEFFDDLQDTPLLKISSRRSYRLRISHELGVLWYLTTTFMCISTRWEVFELSLQSYYGILQSACELHLGIAKSSENQIWYPAAIAFTFIILFFQYNALLCRDMLAFTAIITMRNISKDFEKAMQHGAIPDEEMFDMLIAYKKLTRKFNRSFGLVVCVYIVYATPYYSLHFVDMMDVPGWMNRLSMFTFLIPLGLACKWSLDIIVRSRSRKRWFARNNRLMSLDRERIVILLDDVTWDKFALGSYFQVNPFVVGQVFGLLATIAIVRIENSIHDLTHSTS